MMILSCIEILYFLSNNLNKFSRGKFRNEGYPSRLYKLLFSLHTDEKIVKNS